MDQKPPNRVLRRALITLIILLIGFGGTGVLLINKRLLIGQWVLGEVAGHFGYDDARFKLTRLETDGAALSDIRLGPDVGIGMVAVSYTLEDLIKGRVETAQILDAEVDISDPGAGFIGKLQKQLGAEVDNKNQTSNPTIPLPAISVKNLKIIGTVNQLTVAFTINGDLNSDLTGLFAASGGASYQIDDRTLTADKIQLEAQVSEGGKHVNASLISAEIRDPSAAYWFPPLSLSGDGDYSGSIVDFSISISDLDNRFSTTLSGTTDVEGRSATAKFTLPETQFSEMGLQPGDLSSLAHLPFPVNGTLSAAADIFFKDNTPSIAVDITLKDGGAAVDTTTVKGLHATISGRWPNASKKAALSAHIITADIHHAAAPIGPLKIEAAEVEVLFDPATGGLSVSLNALHLRPLKDKALMVFPPLRFTGKGTYLESNVTFSLSASDLENQILPSLSGTANINNRSARARVTLPALTFSDGGLQPGDLSSLTQLPTPITGTVAGWVEASLTEGQPLIKSEISIVDGGGIVDQTSVTGLQAGLTGHWPDTQGRAALTVRIPGALIAHNDIVLKVSSALVRAQIDPKTEMVSAALTDLRLSHLTDMPLVNPLRLTGTGELDAGQIYFDLSAFMDTPDPAQNILTASGRHQLAEGSGSATLTVPELNFTPGFFEPKDITPLAPALANVSGHVSGRSDVAWSPAGVTASARGKVSDLTITTDTVSIKGINADLRLPSVLPLRTDTPQTIQAAQISSAISLKNPSIRFSVSETGPNSGMSRGPILRVHKLTTEIIGGTLTIDDLLVNPAKSSHQFVVALDHLDLEKVFGLIKLEGVTAVGKISGTIPVVIDGDDIEIIQGVLKSDGPGVLQFRSEQAKQALSSGGSQVDLLLRALDDFQYTALSLKIGRRRSGSAHIGLHLDGHNPAVLDGHTFNLNINLDGNVDSLLGALMEGLRLSDRAIRATVGGVK